ncbi:MAG: hypothetical protein JNL82_29780 [Myxococcales bacterium]|nr:hypothetical protein [Myxococcales bacterium]
MTAAAKRRRGPEPQTVDLFAAPPAPATTAPALTLVAEPELPVALRRRRDFAADVERVVAGRHLVIRTHVTEPTRGGEGRAWKFDEYLAYELVGDGESYGALAPGDAAYGRIDTRRRRDPEADPLEHQRACQVEAVTVIGEVCPEAALARGEGPAAVGVYPGPGYVRTTGDGSARLGRLRAAAGRAAP